MPGRFYDRAVMSRGWPAGGAGVVVRGLINRPSLVSKRSVDQKYNEPLRETEEAR